MADQQVLLAQQWLNATYSIRAGWVPLAEDGVTGWNTIYGLRRALQVELGITVLSSAFGPSTTSAYSSLIGEISTTSNTTPNVLQILSAALFCKGYPGIYSGGQVHFDALESSVASVLSDLGLQNGRTAVNVKVMASLLSMDAYRIPIGSNGHPELRLAQQWLNATFSARRDFQLVPPDGRFTRQTLDATLYALQYQFGMADGVANGNFGPGTKTGLRDKAIVRLGDTDGGTHFVRLYQLILLANNLNVLFTGTFDNGTYEVTRTYQQFMELPVTGDGDYTTWCNLLVSNGDSDLPTVGMDTNVQLTVSHANALATQGYSYAGRYTVGAGKHITSPEMDVLRQAGIKIFPIHQRSNNSISHLTRETGLTQGHEALQRSYVLGFPKDTVVYFAVDFDATDPGIQGPIKDFFRGVNDAVNSAIEYRIKVGIYGTRNVCTQIIEAGLATSAFIAGASYRFSGNMGYPMPEKWDFNQIATDLPLPAGTHGQGLDKVVVRNNAPAVDLTHVTTPPTNQNPTYTSATGFDAIYQWIAEIEVRTECRLASYKAENPVEAALHPEYFQPSAIAISVPHIIRKERYYEGAYDKMWKYYTPHPGTFSKADKAVSEATTIHPYPLEDDSYDLPHLVATLAGYKVWGSSSAYNKAHIGDLGGWALDLLQECGRYFKEEREENLEDWLVENIGSPVEGSFGWLDLLADADAFLMYKNARSYNPRLSQYCAFAFSTPPTDRIKKFHQERFDASEGNIVAAVQHLANAFDAIVGHNEIKDAFRMAAEMDNDLTLDQAAQAGRAFHKALIRIYSS